MIEYHGSILSTDGKVISRHNLFCKEVGSGVVEATGTHDVELWQGEQKNRGHPSDSEQMNRRQQRN